MKTAVKQFVKDVFGAVGLDIRLKRDGPAPASGPARASMDGGLRQLVKMGLRPRTVIDAGVADATPELYQQFGDADILLIEPQVEFEPFLKKICATSRAQYVLAAAGPAPGLAQFNVHRDKYSSSLLKEVEGAWVDGVSREVPVVTIDQVVAEKKLQGPYLIKLDVQGAELQVLAGASRTLKETEAVVLEATLFGTMIGGPQLFDVVSRMKQLGFVVYDIFGFNYRPLDGALAQVDMIFVQEQGRFREQHAFATPKWREEQARLSAEHIAALERARR